MRRLIAALLVVTCASGAYAGDAVPMTDAERQAFRAEIRQYLLDNPEVLVEAMDVLKARDEARAAALETAILTKHKAAFFASPADWVGGNPDGDVTIVEFMDYRCGYCRKAYSEVEELVSNDGNIRYVRKEFPILGEDSLISARFAVAVKLLHGDDAYKGAHDALIEMKVAPDEATLTQLAEGLGLDPGPVLARMAEGDVTEILKGNHGTADLLEISGTPTFIINDQVIRGYVPLADMRAYVAAMREDSLVRRAESPAFLDQPYGPLDRNKTDFFPAADLSAPCLFFIHGGYWQELDRTLSRFAAFALHQRGWGCVIVGYPTAPHGSIPTMIDACADAIRWTRAALLPESLVVCGSSAGAHLAAAGEADVLDAIAVELNEDRVVIAAQRVVAIHFAGRSGQFVKIAGIFVVIQDHLLVELA